MTPAHDALPRTIGRYYRIESRIGIGGMGIVYRGTDLHLNRPVAIKAIHDDRLRDGNNRLRAEAVAAASIDHPYICKVYALVEEDDETYLVMEYVEGQTLSSMLRAGPPSLHQTMQLASEVVEGLVTAHARGLVHRDVKPSNVMITKDGHAKLLDFGLAREDVIAMPFEHTRTSPSEQSAYAGTPQYMSPEQAEGGPVTARADLFSVGVLIFECLSGKLPFAGSSPYDYVRHLLSDNPRRLDRLAPGAPADLVRLVEQCLEKTPADRPESAAAVLAELRRVGAAITSAGTPFNTSGAERAKTRWQVTAAVTAGLAMAFVAWQVYFNAPPADPLRRSRPLVTWPSEEDGSRVSPDGRWVSFISLRDGPPTLFVQQVDGADARVVTLTAGRLLSHAWSPDGNSIACVIQRSDGLVLQVFQAFFGGAAQQTVPVDAATARVLRWIDRRVYLLSARGDSRRILQVVDLDTGSLTNLTESWVIDGTLLSLDVRPDGRQAVAAVRTGGRDDLWLTPLDAWRPERLTNDEFYELNPIWSGTGRSIIYSTNRGGQDDLWELVVATGRHRALTSSQTEERPGGVSADDRVITFSQNEDEARVWFVDPAVPVNRQLTADAMSDLTPALSADGTRLVFQRSQPSPAQGFQILDSKLFSAGMTGGSLLSEPRPAADGFAGLLSPDGARLAYLQRGNEPGRTTLFVRHLGTDDVVRVSATARLPVLTQFPVEWAEQLAAWSPAGDALYYVDRPDETFGIRRFRVGAAEPDEPLFRFDGEYIRDLHVSPDGTRLAFLTWTDGVFELHAVDLESGRDQVLAQLGAPLSRVFNRGWMPDARRVVLISVSAVHEDVSADIDVLIASAGRQPEVVATVANGFAATTRLDPARAVLYLTRVANGVHNAYAVGLEGRGVVPVTDNRLPGVTFSGIRPVPGGGLVVVQNERKRDIWVIETADK